MALHDEGTPKVIYHVVQKSLWDAAQAAGVNYFPPRYDIEGFIHATHEANLLLGVLNWEHPKHGFIYKKIEGTFVCLAIDTEVLASPVKMEAAAPTESNPNPVAFPHIFGPIVPLSCVTNYMQVTRDPADGTFLSIEGPQSAAQPQPQAAATADYLSPALPPAMHDTVEAIDDMDSGDGLGSAKRGRPAGAKVPRWSPEEDEILKSLVAEYGERAWKEIAAKLENQRSASAVEQHYQILVGKRKRPGAKEGEGEGEELDEATKAERAIKLAEEKATKDQAKAEREKAAEEKKAIKDAAKAAAAEKAAAKKGVPKRPRSSYLFYCEEMRDGLKAENPTLTVVTLAKMLAETWRALDPEGQAKYVALAEADEERFKTEMAAGSYPLTKEAEKKARKDRGEPSEPNKVKKAKMSL